MQQADKGGQSADLTVGFSDGITGRGNAGMTFRYFLYTPQPTMTSSTFSMNVVLLSTLPVSGFVNW